MVNSRRYLNDSLMQQAISRSPNAPAVQSPDSLAAAHAAEQARTKNAMLGNERQLGLGQRRLDLGADQLAFQKQSAADTLRTEKNAFETGKDYAGRANILNTLGLGADIYGAYKTQKNSEEQLSALQELINSNNTMNDKSKSFVFNFLKNLRSYSG